MAAAITPAALNVRILVALAVVVVASRGAGWAISKIGQPRVHGEILAGIALGPSILGVLWPQALAYLFPSPVIGVLNVVAQVGIVFFMFLVGLSLDLNRLRGQGHKAVLISHASIITPLVLGGVLSIWLYPRLGGHVDRLGFALFIGAAMAITAFPVLARVLQETGLTDTRVGVLAITCAAVDDVTAWCILAVVVAVIHAGGFANVVQTIALSVVFLTVMLKVMKPLLTRLTTIPLWIGICFPLLAGWTTAQIGIHAIFGAFMAGAVMSRKPEVQREIHERLEPVAVGFLLPIFFVSVGLATQVNLLNSAYLWGVTAVVIITAIAGKWGGSMLAARAMKETWGDAAAIGILMNTRGLTELVILTVGLQLRVITPTIFTIMVLMALTTTLMATPLLALVSPIYHRGMTAPAAPRAAGFDAVGGAPPATGTDEP
jgi:Kef-type K+ transport system membrane component KefB